MIRTASSRAATSVPGEFEPSPMELHPVFLSSVQFAFVIAFHLLLPPFTVGLASFIVLPVPAGRHAVPAADHLHVHRLAYYVSRGKVTSHVGYH